MIPKWFKYWLKYKYAPSYAIIRACDDNNINKLRHILSTSSSKNIEKMLITINIHQCTPLMISSNRNNIYILQTLLDTGLSHPEFQNKDGQTALMIAMIGFVGVTDVGKLLISLLPVDVINLRNIHGTTALMMAAFRGYTEYVKLLLLRDENGVEYQNNEGYTALIYASAGGHLETVKVLVNVHNQNHIRLQNIDGFTALMAAIEGCYINNIKESIISDIVCVLLDTKQSYPEAQSKTESMTALMLASEKGYGDIVKILLEYN